MLEMLRTSKGVMLVLKHVGTRVDENAAAQPTTDARYGHYVWSALTRRIGGSIGERIHLSSFSLSVPPSPRVI